MVRSFTIEEVVKFIGEHSFHSDYDTDYKDGWKDCVDKITQNFVTEFIVSEEKCNAPGIYQPTNTCVRPRGHQGKHIGSKGSIWSEPVAESI